MKRPLIKKIILTILVPAIILPAIVFNFSIVKESNLKIKLISNQALAFSQKILAPYTSYFFPRYPQRLKYIVLEISEASQQAVSLNENLSESLEQCDCQFSQSSCRRINNLCLPSSLGTFGDPCPNREEIEKKKLEIKEKNKHISFLRELLIKEMETDLEKELETLKPEIAEEITDNLEEVLEQSQGIILTENESINLPDQCSAEKCSASCQLGNIFKIEACVRAGVGEQKPIAINFNAKLELEDLELEPVKIKNINLGLPKEIEIPDLGKLSEFTIFGSKAIIDTTDIEKTPIEPIKLQATQMPSLPELPSLNLSCSDFSGSKTSYSCGISQKSEEESIEHNWYFQRFSYLSEKCQELPGMSDQVSLKAAAEGCFDPERIPQTIVQRCSELWAEHCDCDPDDPSHPRPEPPEFCQQIWKSCSGNGQIAAADRCQELFIQEGLPIPSECSYTITKNYGNKLKIIDYEWEWNDLNNSYEWQPFWKYSKCCPSDYPIDEGGIVCSNHIYNTSANFNPVAVFDAKCEEFISEGRMDPPELCKMLPIFSGSIRTPKKETFISEGGECLSQTISDIPSSLLGCDNFLPTKPKITLPKIIIPDIILPTFNISPFLILKLPSFIFEDLIFEDIELCDLDDCQDFLPDLNFGFPVLSLPEINIKPIELGEVLGKPLPDIQAPSFKLPNIPMPFPQTPKLNNLISPDLDLPDISMPKPKLSLSSSGIDLNAIFGYIATFIINAKKIPNQSLCVSYNLTFITLQMIFPDYHFYWPAFPKIPKIPFCKDIIDFCQKTKAGLKEVFDEAKEIESFFNAFVQTEIQKKLDEKAIEIKKEIEASIHQQIEEQRDKIRADAEAQIKKGQKEIIISVDDIKVPEFSLNEILDLPEKITIPWPEELKTIILNDSMSYDLPTIPLEKLNYEENFTIKGPGFQSKSFSFSFDASGNLGKCLAKKPSSKNPCPQSQFQENIDNIKNIQTQINEASKKVVNILE
jgi:hypothetical protein